MKDDALEAIAVALVEHADEILEANARDVELGREGHLSDALLDRLTLTDRRIAEMAAGVRKIAALPDPVGEVIDGSTLPNGLQLRRVRVPLGVVAVVYEARPNVTIDAAALCLKSGNAVVLRGSSSAGALKRGARRRRLRGRRRGRSAGRGDIPAGRRRPRRAGRARDPDRRRGSDHPARGRGTQSRAQGRGDDPRDLCRLGQQPHLCRRERRSGRGRGDRPELKAPASRDLQRVREAARPQRRRAVVPAQGPAGA